MNLVYTVGRGGENLVDVFDAVDVVKDSHLAVVCVGVAYVEGCKEKACYAD